MRLLLFGILTMFLFSLYAQDSTSMLNLGARINYENKDGLRNMHSQLIAGIGIEELKINGLIGYNKLFDYYLKTLPDTLSIDYVSLGFNVQYRLFERFRISPLADFTVGTGLKSQKSSSTYLYYNGNPDYGPEYDNFVDLGKFIRVSLYTSLSAMVDMSFDRFNIQAGGGLKLTRIKKEQTFDDRRAYINQKHFELSIAAVYKLPIKKNK